MKMKYAIKIVAFVVIFALIFGTISKIVTAPGDYRNYQWVAGFYEEPEESLDAVYIGSSNCYSFWNPMTAWQEYGINVWPYATNGMMFEATEYIMKEARKTQPDAVYIVNVNALCDLDVDASRIHWNTDYMPFSLNKLALINRLTEVNGYSLSESMEFYIPMVRYHDRWSQLESEDFNYEIDGMKGAAQHGPYLKQSNDVTNKYVVSDERAELSEEILETINSLLDYCDKEKVQVLFVTVPRAEDDEEAVPVFHAVNDLIESRGYPVLYLTESLEEMNLDLTTDYYNFRHTNVHGSIKYTRYLAEYLIANYNFEDKRGDEEYKSWDQGWKKYEKVIAPWILDFELDGQYRDYNLEAPENLCGELTEKGISLTWDRTEGAENYVVYRKVGANGNWKEVGKTDEMIFVDADYKEGENTYRVVPCRYENSETFYGSFNYKGVSIKVK